MELLTDWFRAHAPRDSLAEPLARAHYGVARRSLVRSLGTGVPQASWQLAANCGLQRFYLRREDARRREPPVLQYAHALAIVLARQRDGSQRAGPRRPVYRLPIPAC